MKTRITALLACMALSAPLAAQQFDTISFGVDGGYPPFDVLAPSGEITGFDIDIANALCTQLKAKCVFVKQPFESMIAALNALFATVTGWFGYSISFQGILGYIFYPVAWVMGVPSSEALQVGSIMATKLVSNEFVAMMDLQKIASTLSPRAEGIISVFLVSFANFSSIGIIAGAIKGLNEEQGNVVSRFGLKLVYGSTLVSVLSASIAALVL